MKLQSLKSSIDSFWEFEKSGDSICGRFIEVAENLGDGDVILLKTPKGVYGVNVYSSISQQVPKLERNEFYIFTYVGLAKAKKSGRDYFKLEIIKPEPEDKSDKELLNDWWKSVTFQREVDEDSENKEQATSDVDDEAPF